MSVAIRTDETPRQLRLSAAALLLANLVPLAGVLFLHWSVGSIVILYWFENVVIGVINVLRIAAYMPSRETLAALDSEDDEDDADDEDGGSKAHEAGKPLAILFFVLHYFAFCALHGVFVFAMFGDEDGFFSNTAGVGMFAALGRAIEIFSTPLALAATVLLLSHLYSFVQNYIIGGEYERMDPRLLLFMPYTRVVAMHVGLIAGGYATMVLGQPLLLMVILIAGKIAVDLKLHLAEHRSTD